MQDPIPKITKARRAESIIQVIEHLPGKHKALGSRPLHPKKK
jgi:hypothetical protein